MVRKGSQVAIIAAGHFFQKGQQLAAALHEELNLHATLINPRYLMGADTDMLSSLGPSHQLVVTLEDGTLDVGLGERIARFYGSRDMKVLRLGVRKQLYDQ